MFQLAHLIALGPKIAILPAPVSSEPAEPTISPGA